MEKSWYSRLLETINADPRSYKKLSAGIGHGPNYIQQMIRDGKEPGSDKLAKLLDILGQDAALYVMTGVRISSDDLAFLALFKSLPDDAQHRAVEFFQALLGTQEKLLPATSDAHPSDAKA